MKILRLQVGPATAVLAPGADLTGFPLDVEGKISHLVQLPTAGRDALLPPALHGRFSAWQQAPRGAQHGARSGGEDCVLPLRE